MPEMAACILRFRLPPRNNQACNRCFARGSIVIYFRIRHLRPAVASFPALVADDTALTQAIGARLHREGHPGLVSRSARGDGDVYALLNPRVLSDPRPVGSLTYRTTVSGVAVEREPATVWLWVDETAERHAGRTRRTTGRGP
jgi:hypothetical protein